MHLMNASSAQRSVIEEKGQGQGFVKCDRCKIRILLFSVQENEVKSNLIAITADNSGDTNDNKL